jgi:ParB/RepB/Spo0J family partition protein
MEEKINPNKGKKEITKLVNALNKLEVKYVDVNSIKPNNYNPNRESEFEFDLLLRSMREDGFTSPVICQKDGTIVDGEHRWRASRQLGYKEIPVVFVNMTDEQMRISTLRHNRARGSEDVELTVAVLKDLEKLGALEWAKDSLKLSDQEITRLMEDIPVAEALAGSLSLYKVIVS